MKKIAFVVLFLFFSITLNAAIGVKAPTIVKGQIEYINIEKNFIKIGNSKYYYFEDLEDKLEDLVNYTVKLQIRKKGDKYFILKIITGYKSSNKY